MMRAGPDKPIEDLKAVIRFLKLWETSSRKYFPYTADRIHQCILVLKKVQQRENSR